MKKNLYILHGQVFVMKRKQQDSAPIPQRLRTSQLYMMIKTCRTYACEVQFSSKSGEKTICMLYEMTNRKAFEDTLIKLTVIVKLNVKIIK